MGTINFSLETTFALEYLELYKNSDSSLGKLSKLFMRDLSYANQKLAQTPALRSKAILRTKFICQVAIHAENLYYEKNNFGKIKQVFQNFLKSVFGIKTSLDKANAVINQCDSDFEAINPKSAESTSLKINNAAHNQEDNLLEDLSSDQAEQKPASSYLQATQVEIEKQAAFEAQEVMARFCSIIGNKTINYDSGINANMIVNPNGVMHATLAEPTDPSKILISAPDGNRYIIDRNAMIGNGAFATVYKSMLYAEDTKPTQIAFATTLPSSQDPQKATKLAQLESTNNSKEQTQSQLESLQSFKGIQKKYDHFKLNVGDVNAIFIRDDYFPLGDLDNFLKTNSLNIKQKKHLIKSAIKIFQELHSYGIHRDVKPQNFLVREINDSSSVNDPSDKRYELVLIDFDGYISLDEEEKKSQAVVTRKFVPPEYGRSSIGFDEATDAYKQARNDNDKLAALNKMEQTSRRIAQATTPAMDIWALGITCYKIWFGKELLEGYSDSQLPELKDADIDREAFSGKQLIPGSIEDMIRKMLRVQPLDRPSALTLMKDYAHTLIAEDV